MNASSIPHLETPRLILRGATLSDIPAILRFQIQNKNHLEPLEPPRLPGFYTAPFWEVLVRKNEAEFAQGVSCRFFMFEKDDPTA